VTPHTGTPTVVNNPTSTPEPIIPDWRRVPPSVNNNINYYNCIGKPFIGGNTPTATTLRPLLQTHDALLNRWPISYHSSSSSPGFNYKPRSFPQLGARFHHQRGAHRSTFPPQMLPLNKPSSSSSASSSRQRGNYQRSVVSDQTKRIPIKSDKYVKKSSAKGKLQIA